MGFGPCQGYQKEQARVKMATQVTVIRHGETQWNVEGRIQGHQPVGLNNRGAEQALSVAKRLGEERFEALYSSDLPRAMETAREISRTNGMKILADSRLREWKLGILEGLSSEDAAVRYPVAYAAFRTEIPDYVVPDGESSRQRYERAVTCISDLALRHPGECIAVVSHGGILDDLYRYAGNIPLERPRDFQLFNASLNIFQIDGDRWEIVSWGDIQHLEEIGTMGEW